MQLHKCKLLVQDVSSSQGARQKGFQYIDTEPELRILRMLTFEGRQAARQADWA